MNTAAGEVFFAVPAAIGLDIEAIGVTRSDCFSNRSYA
jgi:hypothetical protein